MAGLLAWSRLACPAVCRVHEVPGWWRAALASKGAGGAKCKLTGAQLRGLVTLLDAGPAAWEWDQDQYWTLARITEVVRRWFGVEYTLAGMDLLLHRDRLRPAAGAAHQQLAGPIVVVWDNLNSHVSTAMAELAAARDWLTVCQLPPYAHELNPVEPVWSHLKRRTGLRIWRRCGRWAWRCG
jgi:DDE superfamily endonuclease/Winged helix-turn helix